MSPALEMALILSLAGLLAAASAIAGALWCRVRWLEGVIATPSPPPKGSEPSREVESQRPRPTKAKAAPDLRPDPPRSTVRGPSLIAVPDLSVQPTPPVEIPAELARRFGAIWDLSDKGATPEAIARETEQPIGQIELILGLRKPKSGGGRGA